MHSQVQYVPILFVYILFGLAFSTLVQKDLPVWSNKRSKLKGIQEMFHKEFIGNLLVQNSAATSFPASCAEHSIPPSATQPSQSTQS